MCLLSLRVFVFGVLGFGVGAPLFLGMDVEFSGDLEFGCCIRVFVCGSNVHLPRHSRVFYGVLC